MSTKRKDNKGRVLRDGESQRSDGRYMYRYTDINGKRCTIYSWRLVKTDKVPAGKKEGTPLRDSELVIRSDFRDEINTIAAQHKTVNMCFDEYMVMKSGLKPATLDTYSAAYDKHIRSNFGNRVITTIKYSDIKILYNNLLTVSGLSISSISTIDKLLHPMFRISVKDQLIKTNPTEGVLTEIKQQQNWRRTKRHALTPNQQKEFLEFIKNTRWRYLLNLMIFLLGTGCRIGEVVSLQWRDCDFDNRIIHIDHNLAYMKKDGKKQRYISTPKTPNSIRTIPMLNDVYDALIREKEYQKYNRIPSISIDGYSDFIFRKRNGDIYCHYSLDKQIAYIVNKHNAIESSIAAEEKRIPILLPPFSLHTLRHTFCSRLCESDTNLKLIQEIMGHSDIQLTMNVYNEISEEYRRECFNKLDEKLKIL